MTNKFRGAYKPEWTFCLGVNVPMMSAIYGGNTSEGISRCHVLKHNTLDLATWLSEKAS